MIEVVWHGRGGQGAFTAARILGEAATLFSDNHALSFPTFGPERRGAPVLGFTKIDSVPIADRSEIESADFRIYLDETLFDGDSSRELKRGGICLINGASGAETTINRRGALRIDATALALDILGLPIVNTAMIGALAAVWAGIPLVSLEKAILLELKPSAAQKNIVLLNAAYNATKRKRS